MLDLHYRHINWLLILNDLKITKIIKCEKSILNDLLSWWGLSCLLSQDIDLSVILKFQMKYVNKSSHENTFFQTSATTATLLTCQLSKHEKKPTGNIDIVTSICCTLVQ